MTAELSFVIEGAAGSRLGRDSSLLLAYAVAQGLSVEYASSKQLISKRVVLRPKQVPVGGISFVRAALQQSGLSLPEIDDYPPALAKHLHRDMRKSTLRNALAKLAAGGPSLFIKPAERLKRFTGFVVQDPDDYRLATVSRSLMVWEVSPVVWLSEWRAYVVNHQVEHVAYYDGEREVMPDLHVVQSMADAYAGNGAPAGYSLDVGVLASGVTALVEVNDGFSIGAYDAVPAKVYARLLAARWFELAK